MNKKIKETEYGVKSDDFSKVMPKLEPKLKDGDSVNITPMNEDITDDVSGIMSALGISIENKTPKQKMQIIMIIKNTIKLLKDKGLIDVVGNQDSSEIDSLYSGADSRGVEYGISNESFDKLMKELKENSKNTINIQESINPRIKKSDLIKYLKNKK